MSLKKMTEGRPVLPSGWLTFNGEHRTVENLDAQRMWEARQKLLSECDPSMIDKQYLKKKASKKEEELYTIYNIIMKERLEARSGTNDGVMQTRAYDDEGVKMQWIRSI